MERIVQFVVTAFAVIAAALSPAVTAPAGVTWDGTDVAVSDTDPDTPLGNSEITLAISPADPSRMLIAAMDHSRPSSLTPTANIPGIRYWTSADAGATWRDHGLAPFLKPGGVPADCADPYAADPTAVFAPDGTAYLAYMSYGCASTVVVLLRSDDGGDTWNAPRILLTAGDADTAPYCDGIDKEWIDVDPVTGDLLMVYSAFMRDCAGEGYLFGYPILFMRSTDRGETWTSPKLASSSLLDRSIGAFPEVGTDGTLYVAYPVEAEAIGCPIIEITTDVHYATQFLMVARSRDGGATWTQHKAAQVCPMNFMAWDHPFPSGSAISHPHITQDPSTGHMYVTWADRSLPSPQAIVLRSTDDGETWEQVHTAGLPTYAALLPSIVARDGTVVVAYAHESSSGLYEAVVDVSTDGGATWTERTPLNTATMCTCYLPLKSTQRTGQQFGHYMGLDAQAGRIAFSWMDNRDMLGPQSVYVRSGSIS